MFDNCCGLFVEKNSENVSLMCKKLFLLYFAQLRLFWITNILFNYACFRNPSKMLIFQVLFTVSEVFVENIASSLLN